MSYCPLTQPLMMCRDCKREPERYEFAPWTCGQCASLTCLRERKQTGESERLTVVFVDSQRALVPVGTVWKAARLMALYMVGQLSAYQMVTEPNFAKVIGDIVWRLHKHKWWEAKVEEWIKIHSAYICARFAKTEGEWLHFSK